MIPTTLYSATSGKVSIKARLYAASRSAAAEDAAFGRVVAPRSAKPGPTKTSAPSFCKVISAGGLTLKQAERLMAEAAKAELAAKDAEVVYQRPSVALHHLTAAVLCGTLAVIVTTFVTLMVS